jgi:hypothetical protein
MAAMMDNQKMFVL